ncbi:NAD(P)/FAD-dependent oxidoreductase [Salinibacterium sp. NK8237]|uniref:protoporphyrinogen/coproporphyrinogen oxidase n=1 Tax=Salinibacterium sp. NK8237 TaxID=2792038 RepID=UPI0018CE7B97|nr:FAD-dependent oxidoreductase [Salinibacterium sp. NK8237]MBH0130531.1 FAD-dependent oxidoreductase [Salinibacterium sp. NK8237]
MSTTEFTVVGGGIAGLVTARRLAMAGRTVRLIEASDHLGGTVASHLVGGINLDAGAESFATRGDTVADLARELGLVDDIVSPSDEGAWLQPVDGVALPLPSTGILGIPATPLDAQTIAVIGLGGAMRAQLDSLIPWFGKRTDISLGALVRRRMGKAVVEKLVAPVVYGVYSLHPDDLPLDRVVTLKERLALHGSLAAAVRSMRGAMPAGTAVQGIRGGISRLVTELAADLKTYGVIVERGRRIESAEALADLDGTVIVAAPGILAPVRGRTVTLATLVLDTPALDAEPRGSGVLVAPGCTAVSARALTHATAKWQWLKEQANGRHVVRLSYNEVPAGDFADVARHDAEVLLGVSLPPESVIDFARREWVRPAALAAAERTDGVVVVGETVGGTGLAGIVTHANATADRLLALEPKEPAAEPAADPADGPTTEADEASTEVS